MTIQIVKRDIRLNIESYKQFGTLSLITVMGKKNHYDMCTKLEINQVLSYFFRELK